jgi:hypothetical protein
MILEISLKSSCRGKPLFNFAVESSFYDTEIYRLMSSQPLQAAINIIPNSTTKKGKAAKCSVAANNDNL